MVIKDLPVGVYTATQVNPIAASPEVRALAVNPLATNAPVPDSKTVTVQANIIIIVIIIIVLPPTVGDLQIVKRAADTNQLQGGSCFKITGPGGANEVCDNDGSDASATNGVIRFNDLPLGSYAVSETTPPPGYQTSPNQTVVVVPGLRLGALQGPACRQHQGWVNRQQDRRQIRRAQGLVLRALDRNHRRRRSCLRRR